MVKSIRNEYISETLKKVPDKLKMLQKHFLDYPEVNILSCVPINMAIIVYLCGGFNVLPRSAAEIYEKICENVMELNFSLVLQDQALSKMHDQRMWYTLKYDARKHLNSFVYVSLIKNKSVFLEEDLFDMCVRIIPLVMVLCNLQNVTAQLIITREYYSTLYVRMYSNTYLLVT